MCIQILFVFVDVDEPRNGRIMEYFRVRDFEAPLIRLINLTDHVTYQLPSDTLDLQTIKTFCQSYLEGKAKVAFTLISRVTKEEKQFVLMLVTCLCACWCHSLRCRVSRYLKGGTNSRWRSWWERLWSKSPSTPTRLFLSFSVCKCFLFKKKRWPSRLQLQLSDD